MLYIGVTWVKGLGLYCGNIGITEEKMEATIIFGSYREYGFGYIIIRSPYSPCSVYLRRTIHRKELSMYP